MSRNLNVSQFIDSLNSVVDDSFDGSSSSAELNSLGQNVGSSTSQDEDLSIFSNTHFFDFDMGCATDIAVNVDDLIMQQEKQLQAARNHQEQQQSPAQTSTSIPTTSLAPAQAPTLAPVSVPPTTQIANDFKLDFSTLEDLQQFSLMNELLPSTVPVPSQSKPEEVVVAPTPKPSQTPELAVAPTTNSLPEQNTSRSTVSKKRKASPESPLEEEEDSPEHTRASAEEDKRRRNTAASARFRIKKKLREQQMERTAKDLQDKVDALQTKVVQLEMENQWLRDIVVQKNSIRDETDIKDLKKKVLG